jgi:uncharacterized protein (DUF1015 family)
MPQFLPFRGLRYSAAAGSLSELLAPPYDVISAAQQQALEARNEHNAVRLELAEGGEERYAAVAELLARWQSEGALIRDEEPKFSIYEQRFSEGGAYYTRRGLFALVEAQPWDEGAVKPHEYTMSGPKADRLKLLQATGVQFSPIFMIARDRAGMLAQFIDSAIRADPPDLEGTSIDGDEHRLWIVDGGSYEMRRLAPLLAESFYVADGHHRYETAVSYRDWLAASEVLPRDHPARFAMSVIVPASDSGLVIRPIHRMVAREAPANWQDLVSPRFEITHVKLIRGEHEKALELSDLLQTCDIVALDLDENQVHVLRKREGEGVSPRSSDELDSIPPNLLRYGVLEPLWGFNDEDLRAGAVAYSHAIDEVLEFLGLNPGSCAFLLNPVSVQSVLSIADRGERMPQKSTFFHPKLATGLVFSPLSP